MQLHPDVVRVGARLRDRFFELSAAGAAASARERQRFVAECDVFAIEPVVELDGLSVSFCPSARFRALRFVAAERIDASLRELFARPSAGMPELAAVFVDPEEFSYRSFENILPLDRYFDGLALELGLSGREKLGPQRNAKAYRLRLDAAPEVRAALHGLDGLELYLDPQNPGSRGGRRFICHSARLADALTEAVRTALPNSWVKGFVHVNPVFRCNRFTPSDDNFHPHVDTPYYDAARKHVSRYTLLIYLTGGRARVGQHVLRVGDDIEIDAIEPMTCVLFRQDQVHEGAPFECGDKLFLRTELIFEHGKLAHHRGIAESFAKACYLTGESVFAPQLAARTHALYDRAAAAHWSGDRVARAEADAWILKRFRNLAFVTNGFDFWFAKSELSPAECAAVTLLDVLNCKVGGQAFRKLCTREVIDDAPDQPASEWIPAYLRAHAQPSTEPAFTQLSLDLLFPPPEAADPYSCCPFHYYTIWDAARNAETIELYSRAQTYARRRISAAAVQIMGEEVFLDPSKFVIEHGKIHVLADQALAPVNFAACWNDGSDASNYLGVEVSVGAPKLLVPPILYVEHEHAIHLMIDLFRNSWMVEHEERNVPVPKIRHLGAAEYEDGSWEARPWFEAAASGQAEGERDDDDDHDEPWWSDGSALMRELYGDDEG